MSALSSSASAALAKLAEHDARTLLLELGAVAALRAYDRDRAQVYAAHLLAQRCTRASIRDRLVQQFSISTRTAYRVIDTAIQSRARSCAPLANTARILKAHNQ